jgi:hypothetical protein
MSPEDETSAKAGIDTEVVEALGFEPTDGGGRRRGSITEQISEAGFAITDVLEPRTETTRSTRNGSADGPGARRRTKRSRRRRRNSPGSGPAVPASTEDDELEAELLRREGLIDEPGVADVAVDGSSNGSTAVEQEEAAVDSGNGSGPDGANHLSAGVIVMDAIADDDLAEDEEEEVHLPASDGPESNEDRSDTRLVSTDSGEQVEGSVDVDGEGPANATVEMLAVEIPMVTPTQVDRSGDGIVVDGPATQPHHVDGVHSVPPQGAVAEAPPILAEAPPIVAEGPPVIEAPSSPAITGPHPVVRIDEAEARPTVIDRPPSIGDLFGGWPGRRQRLEARKVRRVVRHIDPWSVLTFSVLFHLCLFAALLLASVLVWNVAEEAGTIENLENFILELGDYETFEIDGEAIFRAALAIAGIFTLAASVLMVLLTVMFNLLSDLIGGIRITVIEEETVRVRPKGE